MRALFREQMEVDPTTTAGANQIRRPNKMLPSWDKDYKFQQNENEMKWYITNGLEIMISCDM